MADSFDCISEKTRSIPRNIEKVDVWAFLEYIKHLLSRRQYKINAY